VSHASKIVLKILTGRPESTAESYVPCGKWLQMPTDCSHSGCLSPNFVAHFHLDSFH